MLLQEAKQFLKRSHLVHSTYKFAVRIGDVPLRRWVAGHELYAIYRVLPKTMLPLSRLFNAYDCVRIVNQEGIEGDIAECGVWSGGCIGLLALVDRHWGQGSRKFHLFDSFQGLPQPSSNDTDVLSAFHKSHPELDLDGGDDDELVAIKACVGASQREVEHFLVEQLNVDRDALVFHVGWFQQTVPEAKKVIRKLAILRLDGDLYTSTKVCLENLYELVVPGGFVIIDDYETFEGCRKAVDEFFSKEGIWPQLHHIDEDCVFFRK